MVIGILASINMAASAAAVDAGKIARAEGHDKSKPAAEVARRKTECKGDLRIDGLCDPICEKIFSYTSGEDDTMKEIKRVFRDIISCDAVCTCICGTICDTFL